MMRFVIGMFAGAVITLTVIYGILVAPYSDEGPGRFWISLAVGAILAVIILVFVLIPFGRAFQS